MQSEYVLTQSALSNLNQAEDDLACFIYSYCSQSTDPGRTFVNLAQEVSVQDCFPSPFLSFVFVLLKEGLLRPLPASGPLCSLGRRPCALESPALPPKSWDDSWATVGLVQDGFLSGLTRSCCFLCGSLRVLPEPNPPFPTTTFG